MCSETPDYLYFIIFIVIYYVYGSIQSSIILSNIHFICLQALMVFRYSIMIISWPLTSTNLQSHSYLHSFFQCLLSVPTAIILSKCTWSFLPSTKQTIAIASLFLLVWTPFVLLLFQFMQKCVCVLEKYFSLCAYVHFMLCCYRYQQLLCCELNWRLQLLWKWSKRLK